MTDDNEANAPALETPASGEQEPENTELETETGDGQQLEGEEGQDEEDELEFGFKKYRVPKSLKTGVEALRADATTKQQSAAAERKALEAERASLSQQAEATEAELDARAGLRDIAAKLKAFENWDYAEYEAAMGVNPIEAQKAWNYKTHLLNQHAELKDKLGKAAHERTEKAQSDLTKRVQETLAEAPKIIPGFKPEVIGKLVDDFAIGELGIPEIAIKQNWSPKLLKLIHLAKLGSDLSKKAAARPAADPTPAPALTTVRPTNPPPPAGLSDRLSTDEWVRRRNEQLRKKAAR